MAGLAARYDVPEARVRADLEAILADWRAHRLLQAAPLSTTSPDEALTAEANLDTAKTHGPGALGGAFEPGSRPVIAAPA
jgi:hypothetical protein